MTEGMRAGNVAMRAVLLLTLTLALLFGWQSLGGTVTSSHGAYPLAEARFVSGAAGMFPGRECHLAADGLPAGLADELQFIPGSSPASGARPAVWLLGSGLRHHYALQALSDDYLVINFDAHADMRSGGEVDCGNWLRYWLEGSPERQAMVVGVSEKLGGEVWLGRATNFLPLPLLASGRAQLWPVRSRLAFFRAPLPTLVANPSLAGSGGDARGCWLRWRALEELPLPQGQRLAVTVDLDCLAARGFAAEWGTGELPLARLLELLRQLAERNPLASISICGFATEQTDGERAALTGTLREIVAATENSR